jgi:hypothetical protein
VTRYSGIVPLYYLSAECRNINPWFCTGKMFVETKEITCSAHVEDGNLAKVRASLGGKE